MQKDAVSQKVNIFDYIDYRKYLSDFYITYKKETPYFSYRYFSNKAGFSSHNVLKLVINGDRNIANKSIDKFSKALNLQAKEGDYFRLLVQFNQSKCEKEKNRLFTDIFKYKEGSQSKKLNQLQYRLYSEWYHSAIRELITLPSCPKEPAAIAKLLHPPISAKEAKDSLSLLEEIGLIEQGSDGNWIQRDNLIKTSPEVQSMAIRNHNRKMVSLAGKSLDTIDPHDREVSGMTLGISPQSYERIKERIQKFKDEILEEIGADTNESELVYQLNFQLFPLIKG